MKRASISEYQSWAYFQHEVVDKYGVFSHSDFRKWLSHYNGHRETNERTKGMDASITKRRKTTFKELINVVQDFLSSDNDCYQAAKAYRVSYQQVYQWVRKYVLIIDSWKSSGQF